MFLVLSKILPTFVFPLGLSLLCLGIAAALRKRPLLTRAFCLGAFLFLLVFSSQAVSQLLLRSLEDQHPQPPLASIAKADAIVVLGGGTSSGPAVPGQAPGLAEGSDRLFFAARLFRAGKAPVILFSGGTVPFLGSQPKGSEAEAAAQLLKEWAIPNKAILLETESRNTRENALLTYKILQGRGALRILLVTSAFHMPRASAAFEKVGFQVTPAPADFKSQDDQAPSMRFPPDAQSLAESERALREWLGMLVYRLRGWA